jgi:prepilin-type processing-associated H-X9-DG protein
MKRRKLTGWEWGLFATPLLSLLAALLASSEPLSWRFPLLSPRERARMTHCQNNQRQLGVAFKQYMHDFDNTFPPAKIGGVRPVARGKEWNLNPPVGWVDALYPYMRSTTLNYCGASGLPMGDPIGRSGVHHYFNGNLSAFPAAKLKRPATLLTGDGNDGREVADGTYSKTSLPPHWLNDYNSPAYRHLGGANYGFVDGHVKWLRPDEISSAPGAPHTFSTK